MSRGELVLSLAEAGATGDKTMLKRTVMALAEEAKAKQQHTYASKLTRLIQKDQFEGGAHVPKSRLPDNVASLLSEVTPRRRFGDLVLSKEAREDLADLREEHEQVEILYANSLRPRHSVLLVGPPGNGKTTLAEAISTELGLAFFVLRYEAVIGSFLGETASRLAAVMNFVVSTPCVLFFDEFDSIAKERGDIHETGEIKRVVSSLLLQFDSLPDHVVLICATNHPELLDRAVWRRFELKIEMRNPTHQQLRVWFEDAFREHGHGPLQAEELSSVFAGRSFAEAEQFALDVQRKIVLSGPTVDRGAMIQATLKRWRSRLNPHYGSPNVRRKTNTRSKAIGPEQADQGFEG